MKTLKLRIKDKHKSELLKQASSVNFVWNFVNELSFRSIRERGVWLSGYDIQNYTKGANKELGLHSQTLQMIGIEYATRRKQFKKAKLKWRSASRPSHKDLGWIPINGQSIQYKNGGIKFNGQIYNLWDTYGLSNYKFKSGSFNEDGRGRWYINLVVESEKQEIPTAIGSVGIDLGLKDIATCSDGTKLENGQWTNTYAEKLATSQRANKKKQTKKINAKIKNKRKDTLHKFSRKLVNDNAIIVVGNVSSKALIKTKMAKSVLNAGLSSLKTFLEYKCANAGNVFLEVNEKFTTQTCSSCGCISDTSPKGRAGLGIREWTCSDCDTTHDRDVNAAKNILRLGHQSLAGGIPVL